MPGRGPGACPENWLRGQFNLTCAKGTVGVVLHHGADAAAQRCSTLRSRNWRRKPSVRGRAYRARLRGCRVRGSASQPGCFRGRRQALGAVEARRRRAPARLRFSAPRLPPHEKVHERCRLRQGSIDYFSKRRRSHMPHAAGRTADERDRRRWQRRMAGWQDVVVVRSAIFLLPSSMSVSDRLFSAACQDRLE